MNRLLQFVLRWLGNLAVGFGAFCFGFGPVAWLGEVFNAPSVGYAVGTVLGLINGLLAIVYLARRQSDDAPIPVEFDP